MRIKKCLGYVIVVATFLGCLAGFHGCDDSKKQSEDRRRQLAPIITEFSRGKMLQDALENKFSAKTSAQADSAKEKLRDVIRSLEGERVIFKGNVSDVARQRFAWGEKYKVKLMVCHIYEQPINVKFLVNESYNSTVLEWEQGQAVALSGTLSSAVKCKWDLSADVVLENSQPMSLDLVTEAESYANPLQN